jgi:hypothetical protein
MVENVWEMPDIIVVWCKILESLLQDQVICFFTF